MRLATAIVLPKLSRFLPPALFPLFEALEHGGPMKSDTTAAPVATTPVSQTVQDRLKKLW